MAEVKMDPYKYMDKKPEKEKRERLDPVAKKENLVVAKKGLGNRILKALIQEDVADLKEWILFDVVIPGAKDFLMDFVEGVLFPGEKRRRNDSGQRSYSRYYNESRKKRSERYDRRNRREEEPRRNKDRIDYRDIAFKDRSEAEDVVLQMHRRIDDFGWACIADLYDLVELPCEPPDYNWGWTRRRDIDVRKTVNGYLIDVASVEYVGDR